MGVYTRFKKDPDGFRKLVELLETTPVARREKMINVGQEEDPEYTERALSFMMTFEDILEMPDEEVMEVLSGTPPRIIVYAISDLSEEIKEKFRTLGNPRLRTEMKDLSDLKVAPRESDAAKLKMVATARGLEKKGVVHTKKIS